MTVSSNLNNLKIQPPTDIYLGRELLAYLGITPEKIKSIKTRWRRSHYRAIIQYLTNIVSLNAASNLKKIDGCLQSYDILCKLEEWEAARKILFYRLNTPTQEELHEQLDTWGYHRIRIDLYLKLQGKLGLDLDLIILNRLGKAYVALGQYQKAEECYNKAKNIADADEINNPIEKSLALCGLGDISLIQNDKEKADLYYQEAFSEDINEKQKRIIFQGIGNLCQDLKQHKEAINHYQTSLNISNKINDRRGAAAALFSLAKNYYFLGELQEAISYYLKSLEIYDEINDFVGQRCANYNLADIYEITGELNRAKFHYEQSLKVPDALDDSFIQNNSFYRLGNICYRLNSLESLQEAVNNYEQYLPTVFDRQIRFKVLYNLAASYCYLGQIDKAENYYDKCLELIKDTNSEDEDLRYSNVKCNLSRIFNDKKDFKAAIKLSIEAIRNYQRINHKDALKGQSYSLGNLGIALRERGKYKTAIKFFNQALTIAENLDDYSNQGVQLRDLGITYEKMGMLDKAFEYLHKSEELLNKYGLLQEKKQTIITISEAYQKYGNYQKAKLYFDKAK